MSIPKVLLAKRPQQPDNPIDRETLAGHLANVLSVSRSLDDSIGNQVIGSLGLERSRVADLRQVIQMSALLHDLGKANSQFQRIMLPGGLRPQLYGMSGLAPGSI